MVLPFSRNPPVGLALETEAGTPLPSYASLKEMRSEPGVSLMGDRREGNVQEEGAEANNLPVLHRTSFQKELLFLL